MEKKIFKRCDLKFILEGIHACIKCISPVIKPREIALVRDIHNTEFQITA